jgi:hypothetical protein
MSNLMIGKIYLKDSSDSKYMDSVLIDDTMHHEVKPSEEFKLFVDLLSKVVIISNFKK